MGCCFSRSSGPNSPYPGGAPDSSRAINARPLSLGEPAITTTHPPTATRRRRTQRPLDQHIDKPLRRHEWTATDRSWTRRDIARERTDFFDTRVTGRPEVWQTIHAALQVLWDPVAQDAQDDGSNGLATAQMILSAAEISLPTGDLVNGVYDALGNYYQLPVWVVADPQDILHDDASGADEANKAGCDISTVGDETTAEDDLSDDNDGIDGKRHEKGKEVISVQEQVSLCARLSENGQDITLSIAKSDTVKTVARKIAQKADIESTKRIRIAYMGKILKENASMEAQGWHHGHVVNALVFNR